VMLLAGYETTSGAMGMSLLHLAEHAELRAQLFGDVDGLKHTAVNEFLRFVSPVQVFGRNAAHDVELHGETIPAGSPVLLLVASANRDAARYPDPDVFDIHRTDVQHLTFGHGLHFCLGASLARLEGRVALDELLNRFPEWDVDPGGMRLAPTSTVRGWERMPIVLP